MTTEHITSYLNKVGGLNARSYHAGMGAEKRNEIQEQFMSGACDIIVATIAFGMGIDKADIRHVYHYNLPKSFENYVQETGRAGRDGLPSQCYLLACLDDLSVLENFVFGKRPSSSAIHSLVSVCLQSEGEVALDRYNLSVAHDIKTEVLQTVLVWLELAGHVQSQGWRHGKYEAILLQPMQQLLAGHTPARQEFLMRLFDTAAHSARYPSRYRFEVTKSSELLGEPEGKIVKALQWLEMHGSLSLKPSQYLMVYQATAQGQAAAVSDVARQIDADFTQREEQELARLHSMVALAESPDCLEQQVLTYFGEQSPPCGRCSSCRGEGGQSLAASAVPEVDIEGLQIIQEVVAEQHVALHSPRQLARFLCGITSPATTRARLTTKHERFGHFSDYLFSDVLLNCEVVMGG